MAHHVYHTDALVLGSRDVGEAGRVFLLYTREFGYVSATAQGIRELKSKLRYGIQRYSRGTVYLVYGKSGWRITNAEDFSHNHGLLLAEPEKLVLLGRVFLLVRRLVHGEEPNIPLFETLINGLSFLHALDRAELRTFEPVFVLRILENLGYVGRSEFTAPFISSRVWDETVLAAARERIPALVSSINQSLKESHL